MHLNDTPRTALSSEPFVSVLIPCRNEGEFIGACLNSVIANGYPLDRLQVIVVDGMSTDGTRTIVTAWSAQHSCITLVDNLRRITPCALNIGIAAALGDVIIRLDAHATYEPGYIARCVQALNLCNVGSSGGVWNVKSRGNGLIARAIACCTSHRFGGAARYRRISDGDPEIADVVPFFCSTRETLRIVGQFNEALVRHQDYEYSARMRRAGFHSMLVPRAVCNYYTRSDIKSFAIHSFRDGYWVTFATAFTDVLPLCARHAVPMLFAIAMIAGTIIAPLSLAVGWALAALTGIYLIIMVTCVTQVATQQRDAKMLLVMPALFLCRHLLFGIGEAVGLAHAHAARYIWRTTTSQRRITDVATR
ncbi:MAG: glycosyltransferase family 2 protein [Deltaproteobacteria bacterium]|nr:glycosyltransferase family 2 protein [Deltaproteobacteria bacterium]